MVFLQAPSTNKVFLVQYSGLHESDSTSQQLSRVPGVCLVLIENGLPEQKTKTTKYKLVRIIITHQFNSSINYTMQAYTIGSHCGVRDPGSLSLRSYRSVTEFLYKFNQMDPYRSVTDSVQMESNGHLQVCNSKSTNGTKWTLTARSLTLIVYTNGTKWTLTNQFDSICTPSVKIMIVICVTVL